MFQMFNLSNIYKKDNSTKFIVMGILLISLGIFSFLYKDIGVKIVSWSFAILLLFIAYLNLKNINELRRYASKKEITPFLILQYTVILSSALLFIFPSKIQSIISSIIGIYFIFSELRNIFKGRNNPYYQITIFNIFRLIIGFTLLFSPLFLSRFIASILSLCIVLLGVYLLSTGNKMKSL